jgi:hypothetical protein
VSGRVECHLIQGRSGCGQSLWCAAVDQSDLRRNLVKVVWKVTDLLQGGWWSVDVEETGWWADGTEWCNEKGKCGWALVGPTLCSISSLTSFLHIHTSSSRSVTLQTTFAKFILRSDWPPHTPPTPTPPLYKAAFHSAAYLCSNLWPLKMGPTVAPETSSRNLPYTPCKIPKTKNQYSFHSESLKSGIMLIESCCLLNSGIHYVQHFQ